MDIDILVLVAAVALLFFAARFLVYGVTGVVSRSQRLSRRLMGDEGSSKQGADVAQSVVLEDDALLSLERFLSPQDSERFEDIRWRLLVAGYRSPAAVRIYFACKWGIALMGLVVFSSLFAATITLFGQTLLAVLATMGGVILSFFIVDMWLVRRIAYRRLAIEKGFPDGLDLLLICIEAGNGLDQAIAHVADEMKISYPVLAEEFGTVVSEIQAGKDRSQALGDLGRRCEIEDVGAFVTVVKQSDKYGVSIADTLRVYAAEMRDKRFLRAEEKASLMPVKLALGAIVFTVPPVIVILIGPSIVMIIREMSKAAGQ